MLLRRMDPVAPGRREISGPNGGPIQAENDSEIESCRCIAFALARGMHAGASEAAPVVLEAAESGVPAAPEPPPPSPLEAIADRVEISFAERLAGGRERWTVVDKATGATVRDCSSQAAAVAWRAEVHPSELQSLMRISYA